jgi:hypothetical protein
MPKIADVRAAAHRVAAASAGLNERLASGPVAPVSPAPAPAPRYEHEPADHIAFTNADGTRSVVCICCCDTCWPPEGGQCPDERNV